MKNLVRDAMLIGIGIGLGYIYAEVKAGREIDWESPNGIIKIHFPSELAEDFEPEESELKN